MMTAVSTRLINFLIHHTPPCQQVTEWISQGMERPLSPLQSVKLRAHYLICDLCKRYEQHLRFLRRVVAHQAKLIEAGSLSGAGLSTEARARIAHALNVAS